MELRASQRNTHSFYKSVIFTLHQCKTINYINNCTRRYSEHESTQFLRLRTDMFFTEKVSRIFCQFGICLIALSRAELCFSREVTTDSRVRIETERRRASEDIFQRRLIENRNVRPEKQESGHCRFPTFTVVRAGSRAHRDRTRQDPPNL